MNMRKLLNLSKTLLVAAGLCVGASNVWGETVNVNSTESAYVLKSSTDNYNGSSNALVAYYTQYRNWGNSDGSANFRNDEAKLVLYKFSLSDFKSAEGSMTSATFTFTTTSTEDCYNIFAVGYKEDWSASTVTGANMTNNSGTITGVVTATGSFQPLGTGYNSLSNGSKATDISIDATTYVNSALEANLDYVSFAVGINLMRSLPLKTSAKLSGEFTVAAATTYTIKYQNAGGTTLKENSVYDTFVGETFTASASDMAIFYSEDTNTKYVYASGNESKKASATASENVITLVFNEYSKVAYTITAKDGETSLGELASGNAYTDGSTTVYWNKFKNFNNQWYETTGNYGKTITEAGNTNVTYTPSNISYFYEFETLSRDGGSQVVTELGISHSNNKVGRIANSSGSYAKLYTPALAAGIYTLSMPYYNGNSVSDGDVLYVYVTNDISSLGEPVETFSIVNTPGATFTTTITVPEGYFVAFEGAHYYSSNSKARIDYLTLTQTTVSKTITSAGWATYCSPYALDFTNSIENLTAAYLVTGGKDGKVTLSKPIKTTVPANTGLLLKGSGECVIPVAASSTTDVSSNKLQGVTANTVKDAKTIYVLMNDADNGVGFYKNTNNFTVGANTAYLNVSDMPDPPTARAFFGIFSDEASGIRSIENTVINGQDVYNLSGQRISKPTKGLFIVNGKKVIMK